MAKGIIYIMTTVVTGLIKIGKTGTSNFEQRMKDLENNGYRNVTGLSRTFAIEVTDYDEKEVLLQTIFAKSRLADTELFALDVSIAVRLLSSFDGRVVFPKTETKDEVFEKAVAISESKLIPDGEYYFKKKKKSDGNKLVMATAVVNGGRWTLKKGSVLGVFEDKGTVAVAKEIRAKMKLDKDGVLQRDTDLGARTPSFVGSLVMNQSINGWTDWKTADGQAIDKFRREASK